LAQMRLLTVWLAAAPVLSAQSAAQRQMIAHDKAQVAEHLEAANKACGSHVTLTTDYSTFADVSTSPDNPNQQSPWAFIVNVTDAMDAVCRSGPEGKAAITGKLKSVTVVHEKTESMQFSNGNLRYAVPYSGASYSVLQKYLMNTL